MIVISNSSTKKMYHVLKIEASPGSDPVTITTPYSSVSSDDSRSSGISSNTSIKWNITSAKAR